MSTGYTTKEVAKIINNKHFEYPLNQAMASAWILGNQKGINLKVINVHEMSSLADYFVLASANNSTQARAMSENIERQMKKNGFLCQSMEGHSEANWILLDYGDIMIHIFLETTREVYDLDGLWKDALSVDIPQEYYFTGQEGDESGVIDVEEKNYF